MTPQMSNKALALTLAVAVAGAFGVRKAPAQGRGGAPVTLPDGTGKDRVQAICAACHPLTNITNSRGNSQEGWDALTKSMIALPPEVKTPMMGTSPRISPGSRVASPSWCLAVPRSRFASGLCRRSGRGLTIRWLRPTARSGGPASGRTSSGGSTRRLGR